MARFFGDRAQDLIRLGSTMELTEDQGGGPGSTSLSSPAVTLLPITQSVPDGRLPYTQRIVF